MMCEVGPVDQRYFFTQLQNQQQDLDHESQIFGTFLAAGALLHCGKN
jgi:hypothetical protein